MIRSPAPAHHRVAYAPLDRATAIRPLDPTEHNMERLNRRGHGSGLVYQVVRVRGDIELDQVRAAASQLARTHEILAARIVADPTTGELWFARGATPVSVMAAPMADLDRWTEVVEADMNHGPADTSHGPMLTVALLGSGGDQRVLVLVAHHAICDAISLAALAGELLAHVAGEAAPPPRALAEIQIAAGPDDEPLAQLRRERLDPLRERARAWDGFADDHPDKRATRDVLLREMESLEDAVIDHGGDGFPQLLLELHALLRPIVSWRPAKDPIHPEVDARGDTRTILRHVSVAEPTTDAIVTGARERGLTAHGPLGAAVLLASALRHFRVTGQALRPLCIPIASPVSLRSRIHPPLEASDLRMAVDVAFTPTEVGPTTPFWEIAARFGSAVTREVRSRRPVTSWLATQRRDLAAPLGAVPIAMISNVGRSSVRERYGPLEVVDVCCAMATHNMFQIDSLFTTFRDRLSICFYFEAPTVSRESLDRFVDDLERVLAAVAGDRNPALADLCSATSAAGSAGAGKAGSE